MPKKQGYVNPKTGATSKVKRPGFKANIKPKPKAGSRKK